MITNPATAQQPPPAKENQSEEVWPLVIEGFEEHIPGAPPWLVERIESLMWIRDAMGQESYGRPLQTDSDIDAAAEALDEALDLCAYSRLQYERTQTAFWWSTHKQAVQMVASIACWQAESE